MNSIWSETIELPHFPALKEDIKTDVLIIGGGITGILCAYFLQKAGVNYVLVEGRQICSGVTKNTTAKITSQHGLLYHKLLERFNLEYARKYLEINQMAVEKYRQLCEGMDCDFGLAAVVDASCHGGRNGGCLAVYGAGGWHHPSGCLFAA